MMDLVDITRDTKIGPIEALKSFPRMQKVQGMGQVSSIQGLQAADRTALTSNNFQMGGGSSPPVLEYQNMLMKQRLINSNSQHETDGFNNSIHNRFHVGYQQFPVPGGVFQVQQNEHHPQGGGGGSKPSVSGQSAGEPTRSNSFKAGSHSDSCADGDKVAADMPEFVDSMFINTNECEDGGSYGWKA